MDKQSKEAIIGATVVLNGSNLGAVSITMDIFN